MGFIKRTRPFEADGWSTDDLLADLEEETLRPSDEASVIGSPTGDGKFHIENRVDELAKEQHEHWKARGEIERREPQASADELATAADAADYLLKQFEETVEWTRRHYELTLRTLGKYRRRAPKEKPLYYLRMVLILLGDIAAIAGGAIMFGELTSLAVLQALASGTAAVTSGLLAHEAKDSRLARKRMKQRDQLSEDETTFAHLFVGPDAGETIVRYVICGGGAIAALIFGSVLAMRSVTEGMTAGVCFGCLAAAVALASWANVYAYTCEVSDLIDAAHDDHMSAVKQFKTTARDRFLRRHERSQSVADSIARQHVNHAEAAGHRILAEGHGILHRSPGVAGHGRLNLDERDPRRSIQRRTIRTAYSPKADGQDAAPSINGGDH